MKQVKHTYEEVYKAYEDYLLLKNYSAHTRSAYLSNFRLYHSWCVSNGEGRIYDQDTVKKYLLDRVRQGAKWQTIKINLFFTVPNSEAQILSPIYSPREFVF